MDRIKVLIVEDSQLTAELVGVMLSRDPEIEIVGIARDGAQALKMVEILRPDIITMDVEMPVMDGVEATKQIMGRFPTPILVLSSTIFSGGQCKVFQIISYGALEAIEKDKFFSEGEVNEAAADELVEKIKLLSGICVLRHPLANIENKMNDRRVSQTSVAKVAGSNRVLGIAASTGGPPAIAEVLKSLPKDFSAPIAIVLHISDGFVEGLVNWLDSQVSLGVKVAEDGEDMKPGVVYIAPSYFHMQVTGDSKVSLIKGDKVCGMMPSGTVLFESIANAFGNRSCGVILTGMGKDGSEGLKEIHDSKGLTIAEAESTCVIFGMPKEAIDIGAVDHVLELGEIPQKIISWLNG